MAALLLPLVDLFERISFAYVVAALAQLVAAHGGDNGAVAAGASTGARSAALWQSMGPLRLWGGES